MKRNPITTALLILATFLVFAILYGPIFVPIASSFFSVKYGIVDWSQPSISAYVDLVSNESVLKALWNTILVGLSAVVASLAFGTLLAFYYHSGRSAGRQVLQFVVFLPFLMPPIVTGLSLLIFFREVGFDRSLITVVVGHTVFVLALVYRTVLIRLQSLSRSISEASYDLGASGWQTFRYILLPNLSTAMLAAGVLAFALSFDETMITILVTGTESTLPIRLWAMMRLGFSPDINALVAGILIFTTVICLLAAKFLMPGELTDHGD
jgi:ABC-type spermidine/putrescine transport system permease subunit II